MGGTIRVKHIGQCDAKRKEVKRMEAQWEAFVEENTLSLLKWGWRK